MRDRIELIKSTLKDIESRPINEDSFCGVHLVNLKKGEFLDFFARAHGPNLPSGISEAGEICLVSKYDGNGNKLGFLACFTFKHSDCADVEVTMASSRNPKQPRLFKTLDSAFNTFCLTTDTITLITQG